MPPKRRARRRPIRKEKPNPNFRHETCSDSDSSRSYTRDSRPRKKGYKRLMEEVIDAITLNKGTDDELECHGYRENKCRTVWYYVLSVLTLGAFKLVMHWRPDWELKFRRNRCSLARADTVMLKNCYGVLEVEAVKLQPLDESLGPSEYAYESYHRDTESEEDTASLTVKQKHVLRYFDHQHLRYIWDNDIKSFKLLVGLDAGVKCSEIHEFTGLKPIDQRQKLKIYGENTIHVQVKSYWQLFTEEVINPFYIFQIFSVILWMMDDYYYYAACIILISAVSMGVSLYETRKQSVTLSEMVGSTATTITVNRGDGDYVDVPTTELVPGDVIVVPARGCIMQCDAVLISGNAIVNESMLTGESVPVTKTPLVHSEDTEIFSPDEHKRHIIFSGTQVIQTRYYGNQKVQAVVVRTGFSTAKGELVRSILFPKPLDFKFYQDSMRFILVMAGIASVGMAYSSGMMILNKAGYSEVILRALDIITIVVPPALPAAMTVGTVYAQARLKKQGIFCISPPRINMCGKLKLICFDKTGTLTEDGLDMWGVVPLQGGAFLPVNQTPSDLPVRGPFLAAMATCHSLTRIDGELSGDPLDMKMFESTNWTIEEPGQDITRFDSLMPTVVRPPTNDTLMQQGDSYLIHPQQIKSSAPLLGSHVQGEGHKADIFTCLLEEPGQDTSKFDILVPTIVKPCTKDTYFADKADETPYEIGIVRQFPFSSSLQRMSVITRTLGSQHMSIFTKGAPEKIASLCRKDTLPADFHEVLQKYTMQGFRVIAVAYKQLDPKITWHQVQRISRDKVETELTFLGLIVMQNTLKPETTPVITTLLAAKIRTVMVTGDNMLTAISVARDCGMVQPKEKVVMVNAHPPESGKPAWIEWEQSETDAHEDEKVDLHEDSATSYQAIDMGETHHKFHFAVTGRCFAILRKHFSDLLPRVCLRGTIFARMGPDQKAQLIEHLQELGYCVGMCGDGANDCGALKMAHAGISLSEAEASVASPFTSKTPNIECVPTVIKEGRAALVTSFGVFKYVALYSMIQFISVLILYTLRTNLGDFMFLYVDLVLVTFLLILMGNIDAYAHLVPQRPPGSLLSVGNMFSIFMQILLSIIFQAGVIFYVKAQPWFIDTSAQRSGDDNVVRTWETTVIFSISSFQYILTAFVFSRGPPYRKPVYTNLVFLISLIVLTIFTAYLVIYPAPPILNFFKLKDIPTIMFKVVIVGLAAINFVLSMCIEYLVDSGIFTRMFKMVFKKKQPKNKYKIVEKELQSNPDWPPVGQVTVAKSPMEVHNGHIESTENTALNSH